MQRITLSTRLAPGVPVLAPRALPLEELSAYELAVVLLEQGWVRRPLPTNKAARLALPPYVHQDEMDMEDGPAPTRTFFTSSVFVSEYLRCLLQVEDLAALGVHSIYHGLERKDYQKMLGGIPCFPRVARPRRGALLPDVELDPVMALAGDANQAGDVGGQEDNADAVPAGAAWDGDDEEFVDLEAALEELLAEEAAGADEAPGGAGLVAPGGEGLETLGG